MKDVTDIFENYRECARHIRNTYFSTRENQDWDIVEDFEEVEDVLFKKLVLNRILENYSDPKEIIETNKFLITSASIRMPLMISREKGKSGYWDYPLNYLEPEDAEIAFRAYFDWDAHGLIDYRYYEGLIITSTKYPEIIGHVVLIETINGRIICTKS